MVKRRIQIPIRENNNQDHDENEADNAVSMIGCEVSIHPLPSLDGLIVKIIPPTQPVDGRLHHVPCDIVLVIDVSESMGNPAPAPPIDKDKGQTAEHTGLTVLDLTKHAANTIIETLDRRDRLAIVKFSEECKVLLKLVPMNLKNKEFAREMIKQMRPEYTTHLWDGIKLGLQLFQDNLEDHQGNVRAMIVLTDGKPEGNVGAIPSDGHIPAMRRLGELPAPIHTFGFGYKLQPGLLQSIAEFSGGNYSFIPDSSMLGTVFIHAVANLQSTFARQAVLNLTYPSILGLEETAIHINKRKPISVESGYAAEYTIDLNTIQYGQSREYYLRYTCRPEVLTHVMADGHPLCMIQAMLQYQHGKNIYQEEAPAKQLGFDLTTIPDSEIAYHTSRAKVVAFLSNLFPLNRQDEHKPLRNDRISSCRDDLQVLIKNLPARQKEHFGDPRNRALVEDLIGDEIEDGQIELALQQQHWGTWGQHFLPSLVGAHARQMRMSFKDPGTQVYGANSPLFLKRLEVLNKAFDGLNLFRPPKQLPSYSEAMVKTPEPVDMSIYNKASNNCFAGQTRVMLALTGNGKVAEMKTIAIVKLRTGMTVQTLLGPRTVQTVLKCHTDPVAGRTMCELGEGLLVTPWHPVSIDSGSTWKYPAKLNMAQKIDGFKEPVYAVQLQRKDDGDHADAHTINVNGYWGVTFGHGLVEPRDEPKERDIRNHVFYGDYDAVAASLDSLPKDENNFVLSAGVEKDFETGVPMSFIPFHKIDTPSGSASFIRERQLRMGIIGLETVCKRLLNLYDSA